MRSRDWTTQLGFLLIDFFFVFEGVGFGTVLAYLVSFLNNIHTEKNLQTNN